MLVYFKKSNAAAFQNIVKKYVSQAGAKIFKDIKKINKKELKNLIIIDIKKSAKEQKMTSTSEKLKNAHFAKVAITLTVLNSDNKVLAKNIISVLNISKVSFEDAVNKTEKFEKEIKKQGILNILMGNNK